MYFSLVLQNYDTAIRGPGHITGGKMQPNMSRLDILSIHFSENLFFFSAVHSMARTKVLLLLLLPESGMPFGKGELTYCKEA